MLKIKNLHASVDGKEILKGIDLEIKAGEVLQPWDRTVPERVRFLLCLPVVNVLRLPREKWNSMVKICWRCRQKTGPGKDFPFSFQYPVEIPGVSTVNFLNDGSKRDS